MPIQLNKTVSRELVLSVNVLKENSKRFNGDSDVGDNLLLAKVISCDFFRYIGVIISECEKSVTNISNL